jgi:hypothetical protein
VKHAVVIQHSATDLFLAEDGKWVRKMEQARTFPSTVDALNHCYEAKLRDTQVVMIVGERKLFKLKVPCGRDVAGAT